MEEDANTLTSKEDMSDGEYTPTVLETFQVKKDKSKELIRREMSFSERHLPEQWGLAYSLMNLIGNWRVNVSSVHFNERKMHMS